MIGGAGQAPAPTLTPRDLLRAAWVAGAFLRRRGPEDGVLLTGSPRSGTTWLLELLELDPGVRRLWEPLRAEKEGQGAARNFGLGWRPYLPPEAEHPELERFLRRLWTGAVRYEPAVDPSPHLPWTDQLRRVLVGRRTVVKSVRAGRLLPWLGPRLPVRVLLLVRHPCAVVASQLHHAGWDGFAAGEIDPLASPATADAYPGLAAYAEGLGTVEERLAATWAFDQRIPFDRAGRLDRVLLVTYEELVRDPGAALRRVASFLELDLPLARALELEKRPSRTTVEDSNVRTGGSRLATWRERLTSGQADRILAVTHRFGITAYTDALEPDRARLPAFGSPPPAPADG